MVITENLEEILKIIERIESKPEEELTEQDVEDFRYYTAKLEMLKQMLH